MNRDCGPGSSRLQCRSAPCSVLEKQVEALLQPWTGHWLCTVTHAALWADRDLDTSLLSALGMPVAPMGVSTYRYVHSRGTPPWAWAAPPSSHPSAWPLPLDRLASGLTYPWPWSCMPCLAPFRCSQDIRVLGQARPGPQMRSGLHILLRPSTWVWVCLVHEQTPGLSVSSALVSK